jgi:hypothetical protein
MSDHVAVVRPGGKLEKTMTHSLIGADRTTHLKVLCVALVGAIAVVVVGIMARVTEADAARAHVVIKAGKPAAFTARAAATVR